MDKTKIFVVKAALTLLAISFVSCSSSTRIVTTDLRTDIESSGLEMNNSSFRYYIDRDVELKASTKAMKMNELGEGVKATVEKMRSYVLITKGTAGMCKETGEGWIKVAFEPDFPEATLIFAITVDGNYRINYFGDGLIVYDGLDFQVQSKPTYWLNKILSIFSNDANGREARLKIKYNVNEKEAVKNRKAKGFN
ncbi:MAG: hypothetical protein LBC75_06840 [Fibromonadaceae bacterium]|jgi:hypothetical protein|nr:hypothetical protein [Fibromonadaceae bacterium]